MERKEEILVRARDIVKRISRHFPDYSALELYTIVVIALNVMEEISEVKENKDS